MPEDMPDRMPDRMSNRMPDRMPEDLPDRMSDGMNWMPWWGSLEAKYFFWFWADHIGFQVIQKFLIWIPAATCKWTQLEGVKNRPLWPCFCAIPRCRERLNLPKNGEFSTTSTFPPSSWLRKNLGSRLWYVKHSHGSHKQKSGWFWWFTYLKHISRGDSP